MNNSDNNDYVLYDFVLFGVLERISRFYRLIHDMKYENMDYYTGIINDIDECLWNILAEVITIVKKDNCGNNKINDILSSCNKLRILHLSINCLPIMDQQIELLRFKRLFKDGLMKKLEGLSDFSIGFVETTIQEVHLETLFTKTKKELFDINKLSQEFHYLNPDEKKNNNPQSHITLPRIELRNPLAWTTIAHEISHRLIDHCLPEDSNGDYFEDFKLFIEKEKGIFFPPSMNEEKIKHHILEYWCDFLGTLIMGGAFLFSQCDAMFFDGIDNNSINSNTHPPKYLRLWLIQQILINRLTPNNYLPNEVSFKNAYNNMQTLLRKYSSVEKDDRYLAMQFLNYLLEKFILHNETKEIELASPLLKLLDYFKRDNFKAESQYIPDLVKSLKNNYIIPSYRINKDTLKENCTTIQDILLAGFIFREEELKCKILSDFKTNIMKNKIIKEKKEARKNIENILQSVNSNLGGFDTCILRSIQISEYVNLLSNKNKQESDSKVKDNNQNKCGHILNENEIRDELINHSINIIPLIDESQIGATSIDVRLGTSFQFYNANHSGILDSVSNDTIKKMEDNSTFIDLDYLEGIVLAPNQFMLGHTMEYLVLPDYIAAELEGRSSYARLGIEIHMTAGFVEPGFNGVLTLELFNAGPNPVKIYPGLRIGQLRFFRCISTNRPYNRNIYAKYKGMLRHNESLLMKDYEIACFRDELDKKGNING